MRGIERNSVEEHSIRCLQIICRNVCNLAVRGKTVDDSFAITALPRDTVAHTYIYSITEQTALHVYDLALHQQCLRAHIAHIIVPDSH